MNKIYYPINNVENRYSLQVMRDLDSYQIPYTITTDRIIVVSVDKLPEIINHIGIYTPGNWFNSPECNIYA